MIDWFAGNAGTILISLILIGVVTLIIVNLRKKKKKGKPSCGCSCAHCAMRDSGDGSHCPINE